MSAVNVVLIRREDYGTVVRSERDVFYLKGSRGEQQWRTARHGERVEVVPAILLGCGTLAANSMTSVKQTTCQTYPGANA